jgi:hypothetical protein
LRLTQFDYKSHLTIIEAELLQFEMIGANCRSLRLATEPRKDGEKNEKLKNLLDFNFLVTLLSSRDDASVDGTYGVQLPKLSLRRRMSKSKSKTLPANSHICRNIGARYTTASSLQR